MLPRVLLTPLAALLGACAVATPFRVPDAAPRVPSGANLVVALSEAEVDPARRALFDRYLDAVMESLPREPGLMGYSIRRELLGDHVWTLTVWRDGESLAAFLDSPAHRAAVREGTAALRSARFARRGVAARDAPPKWAEAIAWLAEDGRDYEFLAR